MNSFWLHPSLILILGALLLPLVPARLKKGYLLLIPILLFVRILMHGPRRIWQRCIFLQWTLVFGRVDALSSVFGYIMSLMCILGTLYGLHVKDDAQHIAVVVLRRRLRRLHLRRRLHHPVPVLGTDGVFLGVPDLVPAAGGNRCSRDTAICWCTRPAVLILLGGIILHCNAPGNSWAFNLLDVHHPTAAIYLIMAGFILNAAVPPLHAWLPDAYGEATFNGSVFMCAFTTKTAVYALCRGFAGMEILVVAGRDHGPLRRRVCRAGKRLPPPARLPHHQPGRLHGGGRRPGHRRWPSTAPAPTPSPTSFTRASCSWAAARCCT